MQKGRGRRKSRLAVLLLLPLFCLSLAAGCGDAGSGGRSGDAGAEREWKWLKETKEKLDGERRQLAAGGPASPAAGGDSARRREEQLLQSRVQSEAAEFSRRLVAFINDHPPIQGEPLDRRQQEAIRMRSDEELLLGADFIAKGGDYQRAIEIYEAALALDPAESRLQAALDAARAARYMTAERFAQVKPGMKPAEVRQLLGQPNPHNVRDYTDRGVQAWFYPKDESGAAAAVWFERRGPEVGKVYRTDWGAIAAPAPGPQPG